MNKLWWVAALLPLSWGQVKHETASASVAKAAQVPHVDHIYKTPDGRTLYTRTFLWEKLFEQDAALRRAAVQIGIGDSGHFTAEANLDDFHAILDGLSREIHQYGFATDEADTILVFLLRVLEDRYRWDSPFDDRATPVPLWIYRQIIADWRKSR